MRIVSANLNKRLGDVRSRSRVEQWLQKTRPDLFLAQEPFTDNGRNRAPISGFTLISTSRLISCWIPDHGSGPDTIMHDERWHEYRIGGMSIHNVYLSPHSSKDRTHLLSAILEAVQDAPDRWPLITGDFNLAPEPKDGLFGEEPSKFNSATERSVLQNLLERGQLVDTTRPAAGTSPEFTLERMQRGKAIRFRCDLALVSRRLHRSVSVRYDHEVRKGAEAFTDHSAILVDLDELAITEPAHEFSRVAHPIHFSPQERPSTGMPTLGSAASHKTAIKRRDASQVARELHVQGVLESIAVRSILDYGCGYGVDVQFYRSKGFTADGYDKEPRFGWSQVPSGPYDLVTLVFVVNVLSTLEDRMAAVHEASRFVRAGGHLLLAARSEFAISSEARRGKWQPFNDGWLSSASRGTFQRGISPEELSLLLRECGFARREVSMRLSSDVSWLLGQR